MSNIPVIKLGVVAVSRDCFPIKLSRARREALVKAYTKKYGQIVEVQTIIENEMNVEPALKELRERFDKHCADYASTDAVFGGISQPSGQEPAF